MSDGIRLAQEGDLPAIVNLYAQDDFNGDSISLAQAQAIYRRAFTAPSYSLWVAEADGKVVATACLLVMQNIAAMGRPSAILESVVVDGSFRAGGIGRQLVAHLCEQAQQAGAYKICLYTSTNADYVHRFYEGLGFKRHGISYQLNMNEKVAA
ncbi:MAG: GNAT family N-acetyltransferase [Pseudomonadota bacterium]